MFDALYDRLTKQKNFAPKPMLFGRSRGGLWVSSYAIAHPERVSGIIGISPVYDFRTYPGLAKTAPAYGLTEAELTARLDEFNPIAKIGSSDVLGGLPLGAKQQSARFFILKGCQRLAGG